MIAIDWKDNHVKVAITGKHPVKDWCFTFENHYSNEPHARLIANNLAESMKDALRSIREEAYMKGFKDAKAKRKKETWFAGWWR